MHSGREPESGRDGKERLSEPAFPRPDTTQMVSTKFQLERYETRPAKTAASAAIRGSVEAVARTTEGTAAPIRNVSEDSEKNEAFRSLFFSNKLVSIHAARIEILRKRSGYHSAQLSETVRTKRDKK